MEKGNIKRSEWTEEPALVPLAEALGHYRQNQTCGAEGWRLGAFLVFRKTQSAWLGQGLLFWSIPVSVSVMGWKWEFSPACKGHESKCWADPPLLCLLHNMQDSEKGAVFAGSSAAHEVRRAESQFFQNTQGFVWCFHSWNHILSIWNEKWFLFKKQTNQPWNSMP